MSIDGLRTVGTDDVTHLADHVALHAQHNEVDAVADGKALVKTGGAVVGADFVVPGDIAGFLTAGDLVTVVYETTITGDGTNKTFTITHSLATGLPVVVLRAPATGTSFNEFDDYLVKQGTATLTGSAGNVVSLVTEETIPDGDVWRVTVWAPQKLNGLLGGGGGGGGTSDHGALTGLADDDHGQYALADGTRGTFETAGAVTAHNDAIDAHPLATLDKAIAAGVLAFDLDLADIFTVTLNENVTSITFSNAQTVGQVRLLLSYSMSTRTITWPPFRWLGGVAPAAPVSGETLVVDCWWMSGGTTIYASAAPYKVA